MPKNTKLTQKLHYKNAFKIYFLMLQSKKRYLNKKKFN